MSVVIGNGSQDQYDAYRAFARKKTSIPSLESIVALGLGINQQSSHEENDVQLSTPPNVQINEGDIRTSSEWNEAQNQTMDGSRSWHPLEPNQVNMSTQEPSQMVSSVT